MKDLSLYIHIPFCKTICLYCNFLTFAHKNKKIPDYVEALIQEIKGRAKIYKDYQIETIYFGGGTPSLIEAPLIEKILQSIHKNFAIAKDPEISIECNPESIDTQKLQNYLEYGINRFSLGIQSFNKKTLHRIARPHDHLAILKALDSIKAAGIKNFGADFIMGLPYQTPQSFAQELEQILSHDPPHLSFYFLSYDTKRIDLFKTDCPSEKKQIAMYEHLTQRLRQKKYLHYEVSNYAKPGFECRHNQRYWSQKDYLGLGVGAHSIVNNKGWENQSNFERYIVNPLLTTNEFGLDAELKKLEYIMLHLRTARGIDQKDYRQRFQDEAALLKKAQTFIESGHLAQERGRLYPTEKGFLILDKITRDLL